MRTDIDHPATGIRASLRWGRLLLLGLILLPLFFLKFQLNRGLGVETDDGNYYYQIARHVAAGDGLRTSVSLYHQGLRVLPQRATVYPLWPWLLGIVARVTSIEWASAFLPPFFFFCSLLALYALTGRMARELEPTDPGRLFTPGHFAVLLFGFNPVFFRYTSAPYTEGLAILLMFGALLAFERSVRTSRTSWALLTGVLAGASYLARYHMLVFCAALLILFAALAVRHRGLIRSVAIFTATIAAFVISWNAYRVLFIQPFHLGMLWDFYYRETPGLPPQPNVMPVHGLTALLLDRLHGVLISLSPTDPSSYFASFGAAVYLLPLAVLACFLRASERARPALREQVLLFSALFCGVMLLLPVHFAHAERFGEWLFGTRHGLYLVLLLVPAVVILLHRSEVYLRWMAVALVVVAAAAGLQGIFRLQRSGWPYPAGPAVEAMLSWIDRQPVPPRVLTSDPQLLGAFSDAPFFWMGCYEDPGLTLSAARLQQIDYIVILPQDSQCAFWKGLPTLLPVARKFSSGRDRAIVLVAPSAAEPTKSLVSIPATIASGTGSR